MRKIKVLPIYPRFPETFWGYQGALEFIDKKALMPPTGLATVLSIMNEACDEYEPMRIVDLNVESLDYKLLREADVVFTSTMIVQEKSHNRVIDIAHEYSKPVVAGGWFPTSYDERNKTADYIVAGEAELTLPFFLQDFLNGKARRRYNEEDVLEHKTIPLTRNNKVDISCTPLPRWDLVDFNAYDSMALEYSRGCPYKCDFCDIWINRGRISRTKTPKQFISEIEAIYKRGFRGGVFIVDDNFIGNLKNVRELLPELEKWQKGNRYPYPLFTEASLNLAWDSSSDILEKMVDAGFYMVFSGIETVDEDALKLMDKTQNIKLHPLEAVRRIQKAGLEVTAGFIVGSDGDNKNVFENLFNFIQEAGIVIPMPGLLTVLNNTALYNKLKNQGRLREESYGNNTHQFSFNFKPLLDEQFLIHGYKDLLRKLFNEKNYFERCRALQSNLGKQNVHASTGHKGITAFMRLLSRKLFREGGWEFTKYLAETVVKRPEYIPFAVSEGILLEHFKKMTNSSLEAHDYISFADIKYEEFQEEVKTNGHNGKVTKIAKNILNEARDKFDKLHKDFRNIALASYQSLERRINEALARQNPSGVELVN